MRGAYSPSSARAVGQRLGHLAEDVDAPVLGLAERNLHDLLGDALDLDVHLQRGDALLGAGDLEVHVAEMILVAEDVGQHRKAEPSRIRPIAMPAVGRFSGTPASISASEAPQTEAIDEEPFELGDLRDDAHGVGELVMRRQHRVDRAPGELAVADLAALGAAETAGLADRVGRKVIVQQERLLVRSRQRVDILLVLAGTERGHHQAPASRRE